MNDSIKIIGLCGRSGSGKGYVCSLFAKHGIPSIDTDLVYREILSHRTGGCLAELSREFGDTVHTADGYLDRKELSRIVFSDKKKLSRLNSITHKYILEETKKLIETARQEGKAAIIVDAPVLFESGFDKICDVTMCVTASDSISVERIIARDGISKEDAMMRLSHQMSVDELRKLCDAEIVNDGSRDVTAAVEALVKSIIGGSYEE